MAAIHSDILTLMINETPVDLTAFIDLNKATFLSKHHGRCIVFNVRPPQEIKEQLKDVVDLDAIDFNVRLNYFTEIPGINKTGKNILSRHIPYIPAGQILPDRSDFSAGNFQIALKYFTVAHVNPCIFKYHSPLPFQSFLNNFIKSRIICQYFMFFYFLTYICEFNAILETKPCTFSACF